MLQEGSNSWVRFERWHPCAAVPSYCGGHPLQLPRPAEQLMSGLMYRWRARNDLSALAACSPFLDMYTCGDVYTMLYVTMSGAEYLCSHE